MLFTDKCNYRNWDKFDISKGISVKKFTFAIKRYSFEANFSYFGSETSSLLDTERLTKF